MSETESPLSPVTLGERCGCLVIILICLLFWGGIWLACVRYGRQHPFPPVIQQASVEIIP